MSNREKWLAVGLVLSIVLNLVAFFALGACWRRPRPGPPVPPVNRAENVEQLKEQFNLTEAQMDTVKAIRQFRHDNVRPVRDRLKADQVEILKLLQAPELDHARADSLIKSIVAAQETLEIGSFEVLLRLRNALTPEQRQRLPELFGDMQRIGRKPKQDRRQRVDDRP